MYSLDIESHFIPTRESFHFKIEPAFMISLRIRGGTFIRLREDIKLEIYLLNKR